MGVLEKAAAGKSKPRAAAEPKAMTRPAAASCCCARWLYGARPGVRPAARRPRGAGREGARRRARRRAPLLAIPVRAATTVLQNFQGNWDSLPPEKQQALARGSQRWISMTPEQRDGAQQRFKQWRALPPEQRQVLRQRWRSSGPAARTAAESPRAIPRLRQMPLERRQELRRQWHQMSPEQRRRAVSGPATARPALGRVDRRLCALLAAYGYLSHGTQFGANQEAPVERRFERETRRRAPAPRPPSTGVRPAFVLLPIHPELAASDLTHLLVHAAEFELAHLKAHGRAAVAAPSRQMEHDRSVLPPSARSINQRRPSVTRRDRAPCSEEARSPSGCS